MSQWPLKNTNCLFMLAQPRSSGVSEVRGALSSKEPISVSIWVKKCRYFVEMEWGSNHEHRASEEDALSNAPHLV